MSSNVLTDWLCDWQTDKSIKWQTVLLTEELAKWLTYLLTNWLIDWLINWLICFANHFDWLTEQLSYRLTVSLKGGYYHLPSMPCAYYGVIFYGLWDENMNLTLSFGEISAALWIRNGGEVGLSVISHLWCGWQNDFVINLSYVFL